MLGSRKQWNTLKSEALPELSGGAFFVGMRGWETAVSRNSVNSYQSLSSRKRPFL